MKKIKIFVPSGIGDVTWSLMKVLDIKKKHNADFVEIYPNATQSNRVKDFLHHFDFVNDVQYQEFDIQPIIPHIPPSIPGIFDATQYVQENLIDARGRPIFIQSTGYFMGDPNAWLIIYNGHHAEGKRIESWYPKYITDMNIMDNFHFRPEEVENAKQIHKDLLHDQPFVIFYMGPTEGNTIGGYNRDNLWTLSDWYQVVLNIQEHRKDIRFLITGSKDDWHFANLFIGSIPRHKNIFINACGLTDIGTTFSLIQTSQFLLAYPSGIGIVAVYLKHPTSIFFRPEGNSLSPDIFISYDERVSDCWAPLEAIDKTYFPVFYTRHSPTYITDIISQFL